MKIHISLNVNNLEDSVGFYKKMFDTKPVKFIKESSEQITSSNKTGYSKFGIDSPPLNLTLNEIKSTNQKENHKAVSHLGIQLKSSVDVLLYKKKWEDKGLLTLDETEVDCCYAKQNKIWIKDPDGYEWEAFVVLENLESNTENKTACCD